MRKYEVALSKESKRLPPVNQWICPNYIGEISEFDHELGKEVNFPKNWRTDFPIYDYKISSFEKIDYAYYLESSDAQEISQKFNAEQVTEKWIDYYEIFSDSMDEVLTKISKRRNRTRAYRSFHAYTTDAIYALNHHIRTRYPGVFWNWMASTERVITKTPYVPGASKDLYARYPDPWIFGAEGDGNLRSSDNIRSISNTIELVQLFTAPLHLGHILLMAQILSRGGMAIFHEDQIDNIFKLCLIDTLCCCFDNVAVIKPNSNSEVLYYICTDFKSIGKSHLKRMEQILRYTNNLDDPPALFPRDRITSEFIVEFCDALVKATFRRKKKELSKWIKATGIQPIRDTAKLLK